MTPSSTETEHEHDWHLPEGPFVVISTSPEQYPYLCECGAFTHDPKTGAPCSTCAPLDYQRRSTDLVTLRGGPFDGVVVVRPINRTVLLRCDPPDKRVQKVVSYERSDDRDVWVFRWNDWTMPLEERAPSPTETSQSNQAPSSRPLGALCDGDAQP